MRFSNRFGTELARRAVRLSLVASVTSTAVCRTDARKIWAPLAPWKKKSVAQRVWQREGPPSAATELQFGLGH